MTLPKRQLHVRLSDDAARRFEELVAEFPGLQASALLRLLVIAMLEKPREEQIETVVNALRGKSGTPKKGKGERQGMNSTNRIANS